MHLEEARNTLLFHNNTFVRLVADLQNIGTGIQATAVNPEEYQASNERIGGHFESQCRKRSIYGWLAGFFSIGFGVDSDHRFLISGRWQEGADCIQHGLNAFVFEGRAAKHGDHFLVAYCFAKGGTQFIVGDGIGIIKKLFHQSVIVISADFNQLLTVAMGLLH